MQEKAKARLREPRPPRPDIARRRYSRNLAFTSSSLHVCTEMGERVGPRLRELASRGPGGSQEAGFTQPRAHSFALLLPSPVQGGWGGWPTGNWKKLSSIQAQLSQATCLAVAYFISISCGPSTPIALYLSNCSSLGPRHTSCLWCAEEKDASRHVCLVSSSRQLIQKLKNVFPGALLY